MRKWTATETIIVGLNLDHEIESKDLRVYECMNDSILNI